MAPYLDPPTSQQLGASDAGSGVYADESFVLPALLRLGGEPVVDDTTGALLYVFPSLQRTGTEVRHGQHCLRFKALCMCCMHQILF